MINMNNEKLVPKLRFNGFDENWTKINLGDISTDKNAIIAGPFGSNLKVKDYTDFGQPLIRLQNIERNKFLKKDLKYVSDEKAEELKQHSFIPGDIVFSKLGNPIGKTCRVPFDFQKGIVVADVVRIRPDEKNVNPDFLVELLNSYNVEKQIKKETIGSTRTRLNLTQVRNLEVNIPNLDEQNKIIDFLSVLNEKIELLDKEREVYLNFKKSLIQQMFI